MKKEKRCWICGRTRKEAQTAMAWRIAQWKEEKKLGFEIPEGYDYDLPTELGFVHLRLLKKLTKGGWIYTDERDKEESIKVPIVVSMEIFICCVCSALIDARTEERALIERARYERY